MESGNGFNGRYVDPTSIPASLILRHVKDPADGFPGSPPNFGMPDVPHIFTVMGRYGVAARAYSVGDEALLHNSRNAQIMRNEPMIMECLEARMRSTALLNWHVEPMDPDELENEQREMLEDQRQAKLSPNQSSAKDLANKINLILRHTPNFLKMRYNLMDALWFGRNATVQQFGTKKIQGQSRIYCRAWEPRHGDKLLFRYDDNSGQYDPSQIGIRVGPGYDTEKLYRDYMGNVRRKVEATQFGLAYWFDYAERMRMIVHKHIIEDGEFDMPVKAGNIHGVGIRSRIYWTWWAYQECLKLLLEYLERSALGIEVWPFPAHNPQAEERARKAATERGAPGRSVMLVPIPAGEDAELYQPRIIEPGLGGVSELKDVLHTFFGHKIKRYVLGQVLSSETEGSGLGGSGVADAHMATLADIIKFDATNLEETMSSDFVLPVQTYNFPGSLEHCLRFVINTEEPNSQRIMEGYQRGWEMGLKIRAEDVYSVLGASKPAEHEEVLQNPQMAAGGMQLAMGGGEELPFGNAQPNPSVHGPFPNNPLGKQTGTGDPSERKPAEKHSWYGVDERNSATVERNGPITFQKLKEFDIPEPTPAQAEAGNYRKGHIRLHGLDITIENPKGSVRKGKGWERTMACHYGYIRGTVGRDKDHVDVFIGGQPQSEIVFVVDQVTQGGRFDEHKCVLGATSEAKAREIYLSNYPDGWRCGPITAMTIDQFKAWLEKGDTTSRVESQVSRYSFDWDDISSWEKNSSASNVCTSGNDAGMSNTANDAEHESSFRQTPTEVNRYSAIDSFILAHAPEYT